MGKNDKNLALAEQGFLCISLRQDECIIIDGVVEIRMNKKQAHNTHLVIKAPKSISIKRKKQSNETFS